MGNIKNASLFDDEDVHRHLSVVAVKVVAKPKMSTEDCLKDLRCYKLSRIPPVFRSLPGFFPGFITRISFLVSNLIPEDPPYFAIPRA